MELYNYKKFHENHTTILDSLHIENIEKKENNDHLPIIISLSYYVFLQRKGKDDNYTFIHETLGETFCIDPNSPIFDYINKIIKAYNKYYTVNREKYDYEISEAIIELVKHLLLKLNFTDGLAYDLLKAWQSYEGLIFDYKKFYREHFIHQFQDFLLGCLFLGKLWNFFALYYDRRRFLRRWFLASMFHDIGYPAQTLSSLKTTLNDKIFDKIPNYAVKKIELETFNSDENLPLLIKNIALIHLFSENINIHENSNDNTEKFKFPLNEIINLLKDELTQSQDHGVVGALFFLKTSLIDLREVVADPSTYHLTTIFTEYEPYPHLIDDLFVSAAAIAGHNLRTKVYPSYTVDFSSRPISALLNFCDDLQEWDRRFRKDDDKKSLCDSGGINKKDVLIEKEWNIGPIYLNKIDMDNNDILSIEFERDKSLSEVEKKSLIIFNHSLKTLFETNLGDLNQTFFKNLVIKGTCPKNKGKKINIKLITKVDRDTVYGHMIGRYLINPRIDSKNSYKQKDNNDTGSKKEIPITSLIDKESKND